MLLTPAHTRIFSMPVFSQFLHVLLSNKNLPFDIYYKIALVLSQQHIAWLNEISLSWGVLPATCTDYVLN